MTGRPQLLQVGMTCGNLERTARFYRDYLGFSNSDEARNKAIDEAIQPNSRYGLLLGLPQAQLRLLRLHLGQETLELLQVIDPGPGERQGQPLPADSRSCDLWFQHICLVCRDLNAALVQLQPALDSGLAEPISSAPQTLPEWNTAAAGIKAFKFRDPEGHNLELLEFPAGKGDRRWHDASGLAPSPLLGIDHSAISVAETSRSSRFYDDLLALQPQGDGINSGPTQDGLDGLEQTQVRITAHRCEQGAGIECLQYLPPNLGRPMPQLLGAQDLAHWQIRLAIDDLDRIVDQIAAHGGRITSPGIVDLGDGAEAMGFRRGLQVADPDGHRLQLVEAL